MAHCILRMAEGLPSMTRSSPSTLRPPVTIAVVFADGLLAGVRASGLPCQPFLADAQIDPQLLGQPGARVTADQYVALFQSLTDRLDDDLLGFLSRPLRRGSFALIVRSAAGEDTLERAMRRAARTFGLLQTDVALALVQAGPLAGLTLRFADPSIARRLPLHELLLRVFWRLFAWLAGGKLPVQRFDFAFASPSHASSYGKIFTGPLHFDQQQSGFWFDAALLVRPVRRDRPAVEAFLADARSHVIVPPRGETLISARVRSHLHHAQPTWPDLHSTAGALHMAASTLQKHLAADGTTFQALKDALRRDLAIVRLNTSSVCLARLAEELGFADSAAFQRAFKRWTGSAPGAYRRGAA